MKAEGFLDIVKCPSCGQIMSVKIQESLTDVERQKLEKYDSIDGFRSFKVVECTCGIYAFLIHLMVKDFPLKLKKHGPVQVYQLLMVREDAHH